MIFRLPKKEGIGLLDRNSGSSHQSPNSGNKTFPWPTVSPVGEEGTGIGMSHIARQKAAFVLLYGSALQSLESHCHLRGCRVEEPHCPVAMCNPALRSTALATMVMPIRKEARMQIQSPWTLDSIPASWKRCGNLLWHKLSTADPSKFSSYSLPWYWFSYYISQHSRWLCAIQRDFNRPDNCPGRKLINSGQGNATTCRS